MNGFIIKKIYLENCIDVQRLEFRLRLGIWSLLRGHSGPVSALSDFPGLRTNPSTWRGISVITEIKSFSQSPHLSSYHVTLEKEVGWDVTRGWQNQHRFHFHTRSNTDVHYTIQRKTVIEDVQSFFKSEKLWQTWRMLPKNNNNTNKSCFVLKCQLSESDVQFMFQISLLGNSGRSLPGKCPNQKTQTKNTKTGWRGLTQ